MRRNDHNESDRSEDELLKKTETIAIDQEGEEKKLKTLADH